MQLEQRREAVADGKSEHAQPNGAEIGGPGRRCQEVPVPRNPGHDQEHDEDDGQQRAEKLGHRPGIGIVLAQSHADGHRHQEQHQRYDDVLARDLQIECARIEHQHQRDQHHAEDGRVDRHEHRQRQVSL